MLVSVIRYLKQRKERLNLCDYFAQLYSAYTLVPRVILWGPLIKLWGRGLQLELSGRVI